MEKVKEFETRLQTAKIKEQLEKIEKINIENLTKEELFNLEKIAKNLLESIDILKQI